MLVALTSGKAGRLKTEIAPGTSWREVFRASEDLLTASVFGRLIYLDGPSFCLYCCQVAMDEATVLARVQ